MRRLGRVALAAALGGVLLGLPTASSALHSSPISPAKTDSFTAGMLATPTGAQTIHPTVTGSGRGDVHLTWFDTLTRAITYQVQRAPAATPTSWSTVNGGGNGTASGSLCTGTVPGPVSCTYDDNAANSTSAPSYNASYVYQVVAKVGGWTAPSSARFAGSLPPASGEQTYLVPPDLNAVSAASATSVWAVGANCTVDYFNGTSWTLQTVPTAVCPTGTSLNGVAANAGLPMIVGAVGTSFICTASCTTASPTWSAKSTPGFPTLHAVSAKDGNEMWAAGPGCTVLFYNGTTWVSQTPSLAACAAGTTLYAVAANAGRPIFGGAGSTLFTCTSGCGATPVWTVNTPGVPAGTTFYGVQAQTDAWAVGSGGAIAVCTGSCNGTGATWTTQASGTTATLRGVTSSTATLVHVVGDAGTVLKCTVTCDQAAGAWAVQSSGTNGALNGVAILTAPTSLAVGRVGVVIKNGAGWAQVTTGTTADLTSVSGVSATSAWAVGADCRVLYFSGGAWAQQTVPTSVCPAGTKLNGVDAFGSLPLVVGDNGVTFKCTAACTSAAPTWSAISTAGVGSPTLRAVAVKDANEIWAVGDNCAVLFYNGTAWLSQPPSTAVCPAGTTLYAVAANNAKPVAGGANATLFTCTGSCNTAAPTYVANAPSGLTGSPTFYGLSYLTDLWAVGSGGTIAVCTGGCGGGAAVWVTHTSGTTSTLRGVHASAVDLVVAVGDSGTILVCTVGCNAAVGYSWFSQGGVTTSTLNDVYLPDGSTMLAVGAGGMALGYGTGAFALTTSTALPVNIPTTYTFVAADLTQVSEPDGILRTGLGPWPSTALPTACTSTTPAVVVRPASTLPTGTWALNKAVATVSFRVGAVPSGGAAFQLLVSPDNGGNWTAYPVTTPTAAGTTTTTSVDVTAALGSTSALSTTQLCLQGSSGTGPLLTSSVDLLHLDVN